MECKLTHVAPLFRLNGGKCVCVGRLVPSSGSGYDYAHRVYSSRGCSPCIITRAANVTLCPKFLIEYD